MTIISVLMCSCVICMTEYEENEDIKVLPCSHEFHVPCIDPWLKAS